MADVLYAAVPDVRVAGIPVRTHLVLFVAAEALVLAFAAAAVADAGLMVSTGEYCAITLALAVAGVGAAVWFRQAVLRVPQYTFADYRVTFTRRATPLWLVSVLQAVVLVLSVIDQWAHINVAEQSAEQDDDASPSTLGGALDVAEVAAMALALYVALTVRRFGKHLEERAAAPYPPSFEEMGGGGGYQAL